jgi:hypothetical protein
MLEEFKMDLHIHSCLSPCSDNTMVPSEIISKAIENKLDAIGITDHNSIENVEAVKKAGEKKAFPVFGGIEITTCEEIHILAFLDDKSLKDIQNIIYDNLTGTNDVEYFGEQIIMDDCDNIIGYNNKMLVGAIDLSINEIINFIHSLNGIAIASHIDKQAYSIISQLGFIPEGLQIDALELSPNHYLHPIDYNKYGFPLVEFSDAHFLSDIGKVYTRFIVEDVTISELKKAIINEDKRTVKCRN